MICAEGGLHRPFKLLPTRSTAVRQPGGTGGNRPVTASDRASVAGTTADRRGETRIPSRPTPAVLPVY